MSCDVKRVSVVGVLCVTIGSKGVVWVLARAFQRFRGIATEASAAFGADKGRDSFWFHRRESVHHDVFDPVGVATRTAAILVPIAGNWVEGQELFHDGVGHLVAPQ